MNKVGISLSHEKKYKHVVTPGVMFMHDETLENFPHEGLASSDKI